MQLTLAVLLTLSTVGGVVVGLSEHRAWLAVPLAAALAAGRARCSPTCRTGTRRGPLFLVFAFTACASLESRPRDVLVALVVAALSAAFAVLVGAAGAALRRDGRPAPRRRPPTRTAYAARWRWHVARSGVAVLLAGSAATAAGIGHPYWAMVSAVVPLGARGLQPAGGARPAPRGRDGGRARPDRGALRARPAWRRADRRDRADAGAGRAPGGAQLRAGPGGHHPAGPADGAPRRAGPGRGAPARPRRGDA